MCVDCCQVHSDLTPPILANYMNGSSVITGIRKLWHMAPMKLVILAHMGFIVVKGRGEVCTTVVIPAMVKKVAT